MWLKVYVCVVPGRETKTSTLLEYYSAVRSAEADGEEGTRIIINEKEWAIS
jgi:hypothetical protein